MSVKVLVQFFCAAVLASACHAADRAVGPWKLDELFKTPAVYDAPEMNADGLRALYFEGLPYKGKPTRVFAWYGAPANPEGKKLPAIVLVHGGGGSAFRYWVKLWNSRGYAAIAMDTCGCLPGSEKGGGVRPRHEHGGPGGWGGFSMINEPITDQWTYHAVADVILAHSLIRSFPEVDADKIGVTGISWGGYLTCIVAGIDMRFKFAAPVYGCGFLGENSTWLSVFEKMGKESAAKWLGLWDPSVYLKDLKMPMLWVTGTNDFAYPMDSLQKSYRLTKTPPVLAVRVRMPHGHGGLGENPEEIHVFAENILRGGRALPKILEQSGDENKAQITFESAVSVTKVEFNFTKDSGAWQKRVWETIPAKMDGSKASVEVPKGATVYYFNVFDERGMVSSSQHVELGK